MKYNKCNRIIKLLCQIYSMTEESAQREINFYRLCRDDHTPRFRVNEGKLAYYLEQALIIRYQNKTQ